MWRGLVPWSYHRQSRNHIKAGHNLQMESVGQRCATRFANHRANGETLAMSQVIEIINEEAARKELIPLSVRKPLYAALVTATGGDGETLTKTAAKTVAVALQEILEVCPNLTVEEVNFRVNRYKFLHPQWPLTVMAICKNWSDLGGGKRTDAGKKDVYIEPLNWREYAFKISDALTDMEWNDIPITIRGDILRLIP